MVLVHFSYTCWLYSEWYQTLAYVLDQLAAIVFFSLLFLNIPMTFDFLTLGARLYELTQGFPSVMLNLKEQRFFKPKYRKLMRNFYAWLNIRTFHLSV